MTAVNKYEGLDPYEKFKRNLPKSSERSEISEDREMPGDEKKGRLNRAFKRASEITGMAGNTLLRESLKMVKEDKKLAPVKEAFASEESSSEDSVSDGRERIDFKDGDDSAIASYSKNRKFKSSLPAEANLNQILKDTYVFAPRSHTYTRIFGSDV